MKNEAVAEVVSGIGFLQVMCLILVGFAKFADPTQYSLLAQTPAWFVVIMLLLSVFCLLADYKFRPHQKKVVREQDYKKIKIKNLRRNRYFGC